MSSILQHKFVQLEIPPPAKVWENITLELNQIDYAEIKLSGKLYNAEIAPPVGLFENIISSLNESLILPAKVVPLKRIAVAAIVIGLAAVTGWFFFIKQPSSTSTQRPNNVAVIPDPNPSNKPVKDADRSVVKQSAAIGIPLSQLFTKKKPERRIRNNNGGRRKGNYYAHMDIVPATQASNPIEIDAPPIRDENGNLILDHNLITSTNGNYIIVTGPNGEQTKISNKFLPLLSYLNGKPKLDEYSLYYDPESVEWKKRFQEWRKKLLQQAYVPTANNFLDIMELKEIIKEN